ncbi:MAG: hypothetical protein ACI4IE_06180 [Eubacterium sp.]
MKKLISVVLSLIMAMSVCAACVIPAMAADTVLSPSDTTKRTTINVEVNGSTSDDVSYEKDPENDSEITFTYDGDGKLIGWEFPGLEEGVDYEIVSQEGNSITIRLLDDIENVTANAIVEYKGTTKATTKKSDKSKSPATGAVTGSGLAVAGAGVAILAALKKKSDDAE